MTFLSKRITKLVASLFLTFCMAFVLSSSAFAAFTSTGSYQITGNNINLIDIPFKLTNQPSINVTTKPTTSSNGNLLISLWKKNDSGTWTLVANRYNSGSVEDTCALNPPTGTGGGTYRIEIKSADNSMTHKGTYSYTDWNN
ncbi:hypothetical protein AMS62_03230 [Bacillus sp. FJAT-18019]|nr:hypothetical protein AMS62_03230 [Bacillus sp. FJAT-18019]